METVYIPKQQNVRSALQKGTYQGNETDQGSGGRNLK